MITVSQIKLPLSADKSEAVTVALRKCHLSRESVAHAGIARVSVDARRRPPVLVYAVAITLKEATREATLNGIKDVSVSMQTPLDVLCGTRPLQARPVVCGFGPAGIFAALLLARGGFCPLVVERGAEMETRVQDVQQFYESGVLNTASNIQFGEGGAGAFSDGKLTTRIHDARCGFVTQVLLQHGAPAEIALQQKPHIGTDKLREVICSIRREICSLGGEVLFNTCLTDVCTINGQLTGIKTTNGEIPCTALVLCTGHSARDTVSMLQAAGIAMQVKPFSVGFRAEHLQSRIEEALYHEAAGNPALPVGEYQLSRHVGARCVYTFCMCPGGSVVAGASEEGRVVTNGMSEHARDGKNANAAVVVSVDENDFGTDVQEAIAFQRQLETNAFTAGGGGYTAPCQDMKSFLAGEDTLHITGVQPTYPRGVQAADLGGLLPAPLADTLRTGLRGFEQLLHGYTADEAVLTGLETRTSSPVRIVRADNLQSPSLQGLYPCGEGAGFAGGIVSAAVDGLRVAGAIMAEYAPPRV